MQSPKKERLREKLRKSVDLWGCGLTVRECHVTFDGRSHGNRWKEAP